MLIGQHDRISTQQQPPLAPQITIAVMGATGSGKTSFVNMGSGSNLRIGANLKSCTAEVQLAKELTLDGRRVLLVDTPGFDDTYKTDVDILKLIAAFLATTYGNGFKLAGVIFIHRISDQRFTGISRRNFGMFRELCGDSTLKNVVLVTNMWGDVSLDVGVAREQELVQEFFKPVLDKGAQLARHHNTTKSAHDIIRRIMENRPIVLQIQRELVDERKEITDTAAGQAVNKELNEQIRRHQAELKAIQEEMQALKEKDEETRRELEEETRRIREEVNKMRMDSEGMAASYNEERGRMEKVVRQMQEQARQERERAEAEHQRQMADSNERLREKDEIHKIQESMNKVRVDLERMAAGGRLMEMVAGYNEERRRIEETMAQIQEEVRQERERADAQYQRQMDNLGERLQEKAEEARRGLEGEISGMRVTLVELVASHNEERVRMTEEMRRIRVEVRQERVRAEAQYQRQMHQLHEHVRERDEELGKALRETGQRLEEMARAMGADLAKMAASHDKERMRMTEEMRQILEEVRQERKRAGAWF